MPYDPRTIAFFVELLHPPIQHDQKKLQTLHGQLFADARASYKNFSIVPNGVTFSNPPISPNANSSVGFFADRVQFREEFCSSSLDDICNRLERVTSLASEHCQLPPFNAEQCVVRSLINPRQIKDSREFLTKALFRFSEEDMNSFARPTQLLGLRLMFPPVEGETGVYAVRVESYNGDPRSVYLENVGTFAPLTPNSNPTVLAEHLRETYSFLTEKVLGFVKRFDRQEEKK